MKYQNHFQTRATPQTEQADPRQVQNSDVGYVFQTDSWKWLERFLILGCEGGTYYSSEKKLTRENAANAVKCLNEDGLRTVATIVQISEKGRAPKNDPAVFLLALAAGHQNPQVRKTALAALPRVCRIGTDLFAFVEAVKGFRGFGPALRKAIGGWYEDRAIDDLMYQVAKYEQRNGWTHRDVLRLVHVSAKSNGVGDADEQMLRRDAVYRWIVAGAEGAGPRTIGKPLDTIEKKPEGQWSDARTRPMRTYPPASTPVYLEAFGELKATRDPNRAVELIRKYRFTHEMVPSELKDSPDVWSTLLEKMPMKALIRNLGKMTEVGVLKPLSEGARVAAEKLSNAEAIRKARVHPIAILIALRTYASGHGMKGKLSWEPVPSIIDALDEAFYMAFESVEPVGKPTMVALDVSGSMESPKLPCGLSPREITAAMSMTVVRTEPMNLVVCFSRGIKVLPITKKQRLDDVIRTISGLDFDSTDCAKPFLFATKEKLPIGCFSVWTDNETNASSMHPYQALRQYREKSGIPAKLAVCATTATNFTIADPSDAGMLDCVGFDAAIPTVLSEFFR